MARAIRLLSLRPELPLSLIGLAVLAQRALSSLPALAGMSFDSFRYLAAAESISRGLGYRSLSGGWSLHWPPGLPTILAAAGGLTRMPVEDSYPWVQVGAYLLSCAALAGILRRSTSRAIMFSLAAAALLLNRHFLSVHELLWSEPWAIALALVSILSCLEAMSRERLSLGFVAAAGMAAGAAVSIRWAMLPIPLAGVASILISGCGRRRLLPAVLYGLATGTVLTTVVAWTSPGLPLDGWSFDASDPSWPDLRGIGDLADQIVPLRLLAGFPALAFLVFLLALAVGAAWSALPKIPWKRKTRLEASIPPGSELAASTAGSAAVLLTMTAGAYLGLVFAAPLTNGAAQPTLRILFPSLLFLVPASLAGYQLLAGRPARDGRVKRVLGLILAAGLALGSLRAIRGVVEVTMRSGGLQADRSASDEVLGAVTELRELSRTLPQDSCVLTNAAGFAWYATRLRTFEVPVERSTLAEHCAGVPLLVAVLRSDSAALERFREYRENWNCADLIESCVLSENEGIWATVLTSINAAAEGEAHTQTGPPVTTSAVQPGADSKMEPNRA